MVVRSPRLALAGDPRDGALAGVVAALVASLRAWQIPVALFSDEPLPARDAPWRAVHGQSLAELSRLAASGSLRAEPNRWAIANGGDMTLLECPVELSAAGARAAYDGPLHTAAATATPVVLVISESAAVADVAAFASQTAALDHDLVLGGFVTVGMAGRDAKASGRPQLDLHSFGSAPALPPLERDVAEPTDPIRELEADASGRDAEAGFDLDLLGLMRLGNTAPALVHERTGSHVNGHRARIPPRSAPRGRALMLQGTHSSAGKSFLVTALARHFSNRGLRVVPFKGQNMSNNSRVARGGEIGVAQYLQALAARAEPDVRMNPALLKPHDTGSHVILLGRPRPELTALPWRLRKPPMWPVVRAALHELLAENDLVLIEGAGSPAEPYMYHNDIVNMRVAREANAAAILVSDAGQGGAIAQSYGTWRMIPESDRGLVRGFVFNKFYAPGYVDLFLPGCAQLEQLTGVPSLGVLPMLDFALPEEDLHSLGGSPTEGARRIAVLAYPRISNFDEFAPLEHVDGVGVVWARSADELAGADMIILPGSKNVPFDIEWMRNRGIDATVQQHIAAGKPLLGVCGGLQMLGERIEDPDGVEGSAVGLGVLPLVTVHSAQKVQVRTTATFGAVEGDWAGLSGLTVDTYQIRHGRTAATGPVKEVLPEGMGFARDNVMAISLHGIFENPEVVAALFGQAVDSRGMLESAFEASSAALEEHLDIGRIERMVFD